MKFVVDLIVSGDRHLLDLKEYNLIQILTPSLAVQVIESFLQIYLLDGNSPNNTARDC